MVGANTSYSNASSCYKRLACAKILIALLDLGSSNTSIQANNDRTRAEHWIFAANSDLVHWCEMADVHIDDIRKKSKDIMENGLKYRADQCTSKRYLKRKREREMT